MERYYFERQRECKKFRFFYHHVVRKSQISSLDKLKNLLLTSHLILVDANPVKPTAQDYFGNLF